MTRICHVFDGCTGWEQRVAVSQLLDRLPADQFSQEVITLDPAARNVLASLPRPASVLHGALPWNFLTAPVLRRFGERNDVEVFHAWGPRAASAACAASADHGPRGRSTGARRVTVLSLFDPRLGTRHIKLLRALAGRSAFAIACASGIVRRRLIEGGFPAESTVMIRPGVDFARINEFRRGGLREELGLSRADFAVIIPEPVSPEVGAFDAALAVVLVNHIYGGFRVMLPGRSPERDRVERVVVGLPSPNPLAGSAFAGPFERMLCAADALVIAPRGDHSTTAIAWAMAAGVPVIGTAVHSVAELIANKVNGLLFKQVPGKGMAVSIAELLQDRASQTKAKEAARGQAYEVFGLRRYVEDHVRLYDNVREGRAAADGITDPALVG